MNPQEMIMKKHQERENLRNVIAQWNANRLDLFELSEPNEELEFHGVMRFYFQDSGQKVATKCIRVASDATSIAVIETLIEKFRPDMRMLSIPEYALYEIHENGDERRLAVEEKPLLVQLNWHIDDREGRFLLRRIDDVTNMPSVSFQGENQSFRRKLSKREKKQLKKQEKLNKLKADPIIDENDAGVAEKLYTELPETSFTRSISNPEAVMRRRRQQKLERKLQQFRSKDGGPDTGGTLKIYGEALCRDVPYKTLLLSVRDSAHQVVKEMLNKYGLEKEQDAQQFCLVQVNTAVPVEQSDTINGGTNNREYILDDDECPLAILMNHPSSRGSIMFHVRRRPADYHPRKRKKKLQGKWSKGSDLNEYRYEDSSSYNLPFFLELNPDGSDITNGAPKRHLLRPNVTEVGSERPNSAANGQSQSQSLQLFGPNVQPRHCVVAHTDSIVTVTPCSRDAETYVNQQRIYETTILQNGAVVKFGRIHSFRFLDPNHDPDRSRQRHDSARQAMDYSYDRQSQRGDDSTATPARQSPGPSAQNYETTFDVDGNVETVSTSSLGNKDDARSQRSIASSNGNRLSSNYERYPRGTDPILPAVLEFREETEEAFIHAVVTDLDPAAPSFKLAPAYCLYLVARYRASTHYRPELTPTERAHRLTGLMARVAAIIHNVIQERYRDGKLLAFWTANASELLHFLKCDRHVSAFTLDAQDILAECVEVAFRGLVACLRADLAVAMPRFLAAAAAGEHPDDAESTGSVLHVLTMVMALLRRCRVNAALTIQLFSQLFHYINMWAFNKVVTSPSQGGPCYCTRAWGLRLKGKLAQLEVWAERQGLELAADCHLARIIQAAHFLQAPKYSPEDMATLSATCFKLNSVQLRTLLQRYQKAPEEPRVAHEHIELLVGENVADEVARSDGREPRLEEDSELQLPFLLPEDGYTCYLIRGVPDGLVEFLAPLSHAGLCRMAAQPTSGGLWTIYMQNGGRSPSAMSNRSGPFMLSSHDLQAPDLQVIKLNKSNNGMGLSIVAAKGAGQDRLGIYIKSVVKGGAADADGQLQAGDQLLKVDGQSLVGITQERAAEYLVRTGPVVTLEVAKQGAIYHGLATLLQQPSPVMARASSSRSRPKSELLPSSSAAAPGQSLPSSTSMSSLRPPHRPAYEERLVDWDVPPQGPRRMSERDLPSRLLTEQGHNGDSRRSLNTHAPITSSKSVPALNSGNGDLGPATSTPSTSQKPHENFNPGYSRTSSTSSIPQQAQSQQARSKSSQNLTDPRSPQLPPNGLGSRQASNPTLHHGYPGQPQQMPGYPNQSQPMPGYPGQSQTMPGYPGQSQPMPGYPGQSQTMSSYPGQYPASNGPVNGQANGDGERFYQNLSVYRNQEIHNGYPNRGKLPSPQDESRSPSLQHLQQQQAKSLRGSQSSLVHRPTEPLPARPASAYLPKEATQGGFSPANQSQGGFPQTNQTGGGFSPANQGPGPARDMMRAEAKLQEMHEEVRRREARGQITPTQQQQQQQQLRPQISGQRLPNPSYPYSPPDSNGHATFNGQRPPMPANAPPTAPKPARPQGQPEYRPQMPQIAEQYRPQSEQYRPQGEPYRPQMEQYRPAAEQNRPQSEQYRPQMEQYRPQMEQYRPQIGQPGEQYRPAGHPDQHRPPVAQQPQNNEQYRPSAGDNRVGFPAAQFASSVDGRLREEAAHRDSPPPPPPPTATHPLYQGPGVGGKAPTTPTNDVRYSAASGEAPRGGFYPAAPSNPGGPPRQPFPFNNVASSPWEREEREKELVRRREAARAWRDAQIAELVAAPARTAQQEEQLRALRLEREFQRRAEEAQRLEEEDEAEEEQESVERVQGLLRMATATQNSPSKHPHIMQNGRSPMAGQPMGGQPTGNQRKPEDMRKEQEAARRRDDELRQQHHQQQMAHQQMLQQQIHHQQQQQLQIQQQQMLLQQQLKENVIVPAQQPPPPPQNPPPSSILSRPNNINNQYPGKPANPSQLRLDNLVINGPASPTSPQYNGYNGYQPDKEGILKSPPTSPTESGAARLDTLLGVERNAPPPPERGSSFAVMSQTQGVLRSGGREGVGTATVKRVSFSDPNANQGSPPPQMPPQMEKIREDPNHFINEAELLLSSPKSPDGPFSGNTPGVIGAQEVYKDPRTRMLAAQQKLVQGRSGALPEKLSFKEKMKMFAMETGEDGTPRDKVKISRAQRDIDNIGGPVSPNNNSN